MQKTIYNGKIYTVEGTDWALVPAEAMVFDESGEIVYVGSKEVAFSFENAMKIDLQGKTVLPGFIDSHVHVPGTQFVKLFQIYLNDCRTVEETLGRIRKYVSEHPDLEMYYGTGFNMGMVDEDGNMPCAAWLDEICSEKPMVLRSYDMHSFWYNTKAMDVCGRNKKSKTSGAGHIHRYEDGTLTGLFTDVNDLQSILPEYNEAQQMLALKTFMETMNAWGYTSVMSIAPNHFLDMQRYADIEHEGNMTLRFNLSWMIRPYNKDDAFDYLRQMKADLEQGSKYVKVSTAKIMVDGVLEGTTAYLKEPYDAAAELEEGYRGVPDWTEDDLKEMVYKANKEGYQTHLHSIGDAATEMSVNAIEYSQNLLRDDSFRNVITHLQLVEEEDKKRMGELKIIGAIQPYWHFKEPGWYETVDLKVIGKDRAEKEYPAASLSKYGVILTSSGDYPVSPQNNPFLAIQAGATRNAYSKELFDVEIVDPDDELYLLNKEERLSVAEMIETFTINGAKQLFREEETGSLKKGKKADFIVIDTDVLTGDVLQIGKTKLLATVFDGKTVFGSLS